MLPQMGVEGFESRGILGQGLAAAAFPEVVEQQSEQVVRCEGPPTRVLVELTPNGIFRDDEKSLGFRNVLG